MKANYDNVPSVLEAMGGGCWRYRWNIESVKNEKGEQLTGWTCEETDVWEPLTSNKITEAVLTEEYGVNYEQKLLNEYNAAVLGVVTGDAAKEKTARYKAFLQERERLKAEIDENCATAGIE